MKEIAPLKPISLPNERLNGHLKHKKNKYKHQYKFQNKYKYIKKHKNICQTAGRNLGTASESSQVS